MKPGFVPKMGQAAQSQARHYHSQNGHSMIEMAMVVTIAALLMSIAIPQMLSARRLMRSAALPREVLDQMRFARQTAISQRQAVTFQYNDSTKSITILNHNNTDNPNSACNMTGVAVLSAAGYPNTSCTTTILTIPLAGGPVPAADISYGVPGSITNTTLGDTNTPTSLTSNVINITFQSDGSVVDASGTYANRAMFLYNNKASLETAAAVSVLGGAGRIKLWRYNASAAQFSE